MGTEVWILGGAGRSARAIAAELMRRDLSPVLVGRNAARLERAAARLAESSRSPSGQPSPHQSPQMPDKPREPQGALPQTLVAASVNAMADEIRRQQPAVVINTVGPFATTAGLIARACLPASHYLDLANDVAAVTALLDLGQQATTAGCTLVTGAGFGVTATESVVFKLCQDGPAPARVRVDMVPSVSAEAGPLGDALAASLLDGLPGVPGGGRYQSRRFDRGRLAPARLGGDVARLTLPDGAGVTTAGVPLGELIAAERASGAPSVIAASSEAPSSPAIRAILPLVATLLQITLVREFAKKRLARVELRAHDRPREYSYGHAVVTWSDGTTREGWLRLGDAQAFTGAVPAEIAHRLLAGQGRPGAFTPAALFGPALAEACGADYVLPGDLTIRA